MTSREKYLYHQIHPLKLATDWIAAFVSLYFFWHHQLDLGLVALLAPPFLVSFLMTRYMPLEYLKTSSFGRYYLKYLSSKITDGVRLFGMLVMVLGAWYHSYVTIAAGVVIILAVWLRGKT